MFDPLVGPSTIADRATATAPFHRSKWRFSAQFAQHFTDTGAIEAVSWVVFDTRNYAVCAAGHDPGLSIDTGGTTSFAISSL